MALSLKMILLFVVPMFVGGCAILWIYWDRYKKPPKRQRGHRKKKIFISADCWLCVFDLLEPSQLGLGISIISHRFDIYVDEHFKNRKFFFLSHMRISRNFFTFTNYRRKEAEEKMAKAIFISGDCWLCVFDLLSPRQLGLGISMISHRFNFYVDEHFKTRKWALKSMEILPKIFWNYAKEMKFANFNCKALPIPQNPLPKKVVGFKAILIRYIDNNVITFLRHFRQLFASFCPVNLIIDTDSDRISEFIFVTPIFSPNFRPMTVPRHRMDNWWPNGFSRRFKTMCQKVLKCSWDMNDGKWSSKIEAFNAVLT